MNLTLIDLPGLTKVAVGMLFYFIKNGNHLVLVLGLPLATCSFANTEGQSESIVQDIENMVRSYVDKVTN